MANDRKEWELTDEERDALWRGGHEYEAPVRVATAAARKALEGAIKIAHGELIGTGPQDHPEDRMYDAGISEVIKALRKELTDD